jgi:hypothetical protein
VQSTLSIALQGQLAEHVTVSNQFQYLTTSHGKGSEMNQFAIEPVDRFRGQSAPVRRPKEFTYFSYDEEHQYHQDARSLRYYYPPRLGADLSRGFDDFKQHDDSKDEHIDSLLKTLIAYERDTGQEWAADIVTWRGMITKVLQKSSCVHDLNVGRSWLRHLTISEAGLFFTTNTTSQQADLSKL